MQHPNTQYSGAPPTSIHPNAMQYPMVLLPVPPQCYAMPCNTFKCNAVHLKMMQYPIVWCCSHLNIMMQYIQIPNCSGAPPTSIHPMMWCCSHLNVMMQYVQILDAVVLLRPQCYAMPCNAFKCNAIHLKTMQYPKQWCCSHLNVMQCNAMRHNAMHSNVTPQYPTAVVLPPPQYIQWCGAASTSM